MSRALFGKGGMGSHYLSSFLAITNGVGVRLLGPHLTLGHLITLVSHTKESLIASCCLNKGHVRYLPYVKGKLVLPT
jgi:hypothetical protein